MSGIISCITAIRRTRFDSAFPLADWLLGTLGTATDADRKLFAAMGTSRTTSEPNLAPEP